MSETGKIQVHAYSSYARLPLKDAAIVITSGDGTAIAMALTDRSGKIVPFEIPGPEVSESQSPGGTGLPYATVNLEAQLTGYGPVRITGLQVFPDTVTDQGLEMVPLSELPYDNSQRQDYSTPPQNL